MLYDFKSDVGVSVVSAFTRKKGEKKREAATPVGDDDDTGTKKTADCN